MLQARDSVVERVGGHGAEFYPTARPVPSTGFVPAGQRRRLPRLRGGRGKNSGTRAAYSSQPGRVDIVLSSSLAPVTLRMKYVIAAGATTVSRPGSQPVASAPASHRPHQTQASPK